jgi:hypothetical protein
MTEAQYAALFQRICELEQYLRGSRVAAWMRTDVRARLQNSVREIRDDLYTIKKSEDAEAQCAAQIARECPTCD